METEETNINNENQEKLDQDVPSPTEETPDEETPDEETEVLEEKEEQDDDKLPFNKHPRWEKMQTDLAEARSATEALKTELSSIKTLLSDKSTNEQKNEAWEKIKQLDEEGLTSYEDLTKRIAQVVKEDIKSEREAETQTFEEARKANIKEMQDDLVELTSLGLLATEEQNEFIEWCVEKLEQTKDETHPQGNTKVYGNLPVAISHFRLFKNKANPSDEKTRLERSKIGSSGAADTQTRKYSSDDVKKIDWRDKNIKF